MSEAHKKLKKKEKPKMKGKIEGDITVSLSKDSSKELNTQKKDILVNKRRSEVWNLYLSGESKKSIVKKISDKYGIKQRSIEADIDLISRKINDDTVDTLKILIPLHVRRYDYIYRMFRKFNNSRLAIYANKSKEQLLGILHELPELEYSDEQEQEEGTGGYNFSSLTKKEQERVQFLLNKAKVKNSE